jgi:hypothetical protein
LAILYRPFGFLVSKDLKMIWLSNLSRWSRKRGCKLQERAGKWLSRLRRKKNAFVFLNLMFSALFFSCSKFSCFSIFCPKKWESKTTEPHQDQLLYSI